MRLCRLCGCVRHPGLRRVQARELRFRDAARSSLRYKGVGKGIVPVLRYRG